MFLEPISSSEINNPLVKIINQLVSEFNIHSPVTSQSEFRSGSEINPDTEFIMVTPIINMDVVSIPVNIQIMHVKHPVGHGQTKQRIKFDTLSYRTKIAKLAHIRMDFRGIMQSAWTRKG